MRAVGDGSEYYDNPSSKAQWIRLKFLSKNFFQDVDEDFMSCQNVERIVESVVNASPDLLAKQFEKYQIYDPEEQQLILRLFKRFYYGGIIKKYGHFKKQITLQSDPPEISARALCNELELNPKILRLAGIFPTFGSDAQVNWTNFVAILAMFLLRKEVLDLRYQLILNFL